MHSVDGRDNYSKMADTGKFRLDDLVAAPFTPMLDDGEVNYSYIGQYAEYLANNRFRGLFINGTLAEGLSLTLEERKRLAEEWIAAARGKMAVIVHVGANCLKDAQELSRHAEEHGADAIAAFSPSYNKPDSEEVMTEVMAEIAGAAPKTPFYYYDINFCTGVYINVKRFLELAKPKIPTLKGLKYSSRELPGASACLGLHDGFYQIMMGTDQQYLSCLALGLPGVVTASFLGNLCHEMRQAFDAGDLKTAREIQERAQRLDSVRGKYLNGGIATAKSLFVLLTGMKVGPVRLPLRNLTPGELDSLKKDLEQKGLLDIAKPREQ